MSPHLPLVTLDAAHPARARALQVPLPATLQGSSPLPLLSIGTNVAGNSSSPPQAQLFQRALGGGNELLLFSLTWLMASHNLQSVLCHSPQGRCCTGICAPVLLTGLPSSRERSAVGLHRCLPPCLAHTSQVKQNVNNSTYSTHHKCL